MKYVYSCQKDVATVMVWDWNNPLEWKIMYGGEILLDFDSQQAFIAGDEGCDQWPPFAVKRALSVDVSRETFSGKFHVKH